MSYTPRRNGWLRRGEIAIKALGFILLVEDDEMSQSLGLTIFVFVHAVLYHQPEKMARQEQDLAQRQENLEKLKKQHGID